MDFATLAPLLLSAATAVGVGRLLELFVTRRGLRGAAQKVEVDAAQVISADLRAWAERSESRARAAEQRLDVVLSKLDAAEVEIDTFRAALAKLEGRIQRCQAGPVCPVRTADTDPNIPRITG